MSERREWAAAIFASALVIGCSQNAAREQGGTVSRGAADTGAAGYRAMRSDTAASRDSSAMTRMQHHDSTTILRTDTTVTRRDSAPSSGTAPR